MCLPSGSGSRMLGAAAGQLCFGPGLGISDLGLYGQNYFIFWGLSFLIYKLGLLSSRVLPWQAGAVKRQCKALEPERSGFEFWLCQLPLSIMTGG